MRRGVDLLREQSVLLFDGLLKIALTEAEARAGDAGRAVSILDEALVTADDFGYRAFKAELHRARGEMLLKRDPANPAPAEEAFQAAIAIAKQQSTRSFELRAALSLAKLYQSAGRPAAAHTVLAPALEGFSLTPEMPEIAEAQALLAVLAESQELQAEAASRRRRAQLQTSYSKALAWSRGFAAEETQAAAASAQELAVGVNDPAARFAVYRTTCLASFMSGRFGSARSTAETYLAEARMAGALPDIASSCCMIAHARMFQGGLADARAHLDEGLGTYIRRLDSDRGRNGRIYGTAILALVCWLSGEVERARESIEQAIEEAGAPPNALTLSTVYSFKSELDTLRGDAEAALRDAETLGEISERIGLPLYSGQAKIHRGWARARLGQREAGLEELRKSVAEYVGQKTLAGVPSFQGLLAELEAEGSSADRALPQIDQALALAQQTGERWTDAFLHRIRGDILLKADPKNPARAEDAYLTAIAVAREQGARSLGLQATLTLANLYHSTARLADAHAVLAPALEGFSPTPEMPEIAEAQALLAVLAETDETKAEMARRERRLKLQTSYGQAMMYSRGFGSDESKTAFARARTLASGVGGASERFDAYYGLFVASVLRGELSLARETSESFLHEAEDEGRMTEAVVARRCVGQACLFQGDFIGAETNLAEALRIYDPERDRDAKFRFGADTGANAAIYLALAIWALGGVERARALGEEALARADEAAHAPPERSFTTSSLSTTCSVAILQPRGAPRKFSSTWAGNTEWRCISRLEKCTQIGRAPGSSTAQARCPDSGKRWRRISARGTSSIRRSSKGGSPSSRPRGMMRKPP
jgi:predicted ATPase